MSRTLSAATRDGINRTTGVVWLVYFVASFFLLFYLLPIPILIGVFAVIYLRHPPSRLDANIGGCVALVIGVLTAALFAVLPGEQLEFGEASVLSFGTAVYTVAAAAIAAPRVTLRDAD